jgi:thymidylate synthase
MREYHDALKEVLDRGQDRTDRTGVGTRSLFGLQTRYNIRGHFPAVTTKRLAWKAVVSELLWFIEGSGDERRLAEILHGTRDPEKKTIWTANAEADYWAPNAQYEGDLGRVYGVQWRNWRTFAPLSTPEDQLLTGTWNHIDQLENLINGIIKDPFGRRHILSAWNPGELDQMALPPCHVFSQFYVSNDGELSCQMYQRSADMFLGVPFNIASYSLLTYMLAQVCNLTPGTFVHTIGDAHIYLNHLDAVREQLSRVPLTLPVLRLDPTIGNINKFTMDDIFLENYESHPPIKAPMAV